MCDGPWRLLRSLESGLGGPGLPQAPHVLPKLCSGLFTMCIVYAGAVSMMKRREIICVCAGQ